MRRPPVREQVVLLVGASSGLGRQVALDLAARGARVAVAARRADVLEALAEELRERGARDALAVPCDLADDEQVRAMVRRVVDRYGRLDTVMVMPGLAIYAPVEQTTLTEYRRMIDVLFLGYVRVTKAVLPVFRRQGEGVLVHVASALGEGAVPLQSAYVAAKHAVVGFTRTLQMEEADAPFAVCLALPGSMATPLQVPHARSKMGVEPRPVPPVFHPRHVSRKLVRLCTRPRAVVHTDWQSWLLGLAGRLFPRLLDRLLARYGVRWQLTDRLEPVVGHDNVDAPMPEGTDVTGGQEPTSAWLARKAKAPAALGAAALALAGVAGAITRR